MILLLFFMPLIFVGEPNNFKEKMIWIKKYTGIIFNGYF
jgi:hypothetical protein